MHALTVPKGLMNCKEIEIAEVNACGRWNESYAVKKIIASLAKPSSVELNGGGASLLSERLPMLDAAPDFYSSLQELSIKHFTRLGNKFLTLVGSSPFLSSLSV